MAEHAYLKWFATQTPAKYWHDSAIRAEQLEAFGNGAVGMTTNPFLIQATLNNDRAFWAEKLEKFPKDLTGDQKAMELIRLVTGYYLEEAKPIFEKGVEGEGYICAQTSPLHCGDDEFMIDQVKYYGTWAPNLTIKVPATKAGITAYEEGVALGYNMAATVSFTVPQVLAVAEAAERGKKRAEAAGIKPGLTAAVIMAGRLDDYLRDVAHDSKANVSESDITQAGIAVMKKSYKIFNEKGYSTWILPAGLRGANQVYEMAGAKMIFSIAPKIAKLVDPNAPQEERVNIPVAQDVIDRLMTMPEFRKAYLTEEEGGMKPEEFITFGSSNRTIDQFINDGWNVLTGYKY